MPRPHSAPQRACIQHPANAQLLRRTQIAPQLGTFMKHAHSISMYGLPRPCVQCRETSRPRAPSQQRQRRKSAAPRQQFAAVFTRGDFRAVLYLVYATRYSRGWSSSACRPSTRHTQRAMRAVTHLELERIWVQEKENSDAAQNTRCLAYLGLAYKDMSHRVRLAPDRPWTT